MKTSRRNFIRKVSAGSLAALAVPSLASASNERLVSPSGPPDEKYWATVKSQFMVPRNLVMMNAANLCPSPRTVLEKVKSYQEQLSGDVSMQYRAVFTERRKKSIELLAKFINADAAELGITRNTSESNCTIIHGLDLKPGDEIILWDQNHPSNKEIWQKRAARSGLVVKLVTTPVDPSSPSELAGVFEKAFTPNTRMIAFSQISNTTGTALPAKQICGMARSKDVLSLVDGAQTLGFQKVDVKDLGCDFYTASTHKWLMGPLENGMLYMRKEHIDRVWPNIIGGGWHDNTNTVDEKICFLGQRNDPPTAALPEIIEFHEMIGRENINQRVVDLSRMLKEKIRQRLPQATFITPMSPAMSGGIVIVSIPGTDPAAIVKRLYDTHGIAAATTGGVRMSPHIYNTAEDIDRAVDGLVRSIG
jgi:selenocysteine lyase/cysteine desulfurase